jgi:hypothetical protein
MGAGISTKNLNSRIRYRLQKIASENDGVYENYTAKGEKDDVAWLMTYQVLRASNGEACTFPCYTINGSQINGFFNLDEAITQYKQNELAKLAESDTIDP